MKKIIISVLLIVIGITTISIPNFPLYLETSSFYFDLSRFLKDYPAFTYPVGIIFLIVGVADLIFIILETIRNKTVFIIQKADEDDYGDIELHFPGFTIGCKDEIVYENIITLSSYDKSVIDLEKKKISRFYKRIPPKKKIAFLAISPMPTLVYAGYLVAKCGRKIDYYHWNRDKSKAVMIKRFGGKAKLIEEEGIKSESKEYVICLSTSYKIDKNVVEKQFKDTNIKYYRLCDLNVNSIKTRKDLQYVSLFIREVISELPSDTTTVHLLLSCSTVMCFAIGQQLNSPALPLIRVYNLGKNEKDEKWWNWSIDLK